MELKNIILSEEAQKRLDNFKALKDKDGNMIITQDQAFKAYCDLDEAISQCGVLKMVNELSELFATVIKEVRYYNQES